MVLQSIVLYSTLILVMTSFAKLYSLKQSYREVDGSLVSTSKSGIFYLIFIMLSFALMMGLRYDVGTDYLAYQDGYIFNYDVGKGEILFNWVRELFNSFEFHYSAYFSFLAFLNISFFLYAFKRDAFILPLLLFFLLTNGDWLVWMNIIRQAVAMCIWIYALTFIEKKKFWRYLIWCLVAIGFHTSAIILIPLYWILKDGKDYFTNIKLQLILFAGAFLFQYSFGSFLEQIGPLIQFYQSELFGGTYNYSIERFKEEAAATVEGSGMAYLFRVVLCIIIILYSKRLKEYYNSKWFTIIYFLFFIGILTQNIFPVGSIVLTRPFRYLFIFKGIMFAYFIYYLIKNESPHNRLVGVGLILIFISIFYLNIITANSHSHLWYQFYFQQ
ncbi:EpsG family protein [Salegentibacter salegens]|uniref:EpsG family protein n=1 Tax=Salegentibacter salegens TaxID=143223 RepID=A0A1M7L628_9FLAO|nr:EpsG family protein [Salegentibacter salegens]PRX38723.1 EpsG-like putative glucosyltransferase [Salegentibacter salegens]SHM73293.1 EpsG family protein [Salegentibacter salegens]